MKTWIHCRHRVLTIAFLLATVSSLEAQTTVTAIWDANLDPGVTGYVLSYGTQTGQYTTRIDVRNVTSTQVTLTSNIRYYFAVQAYTGSQISGYSTEVVLDLGNHPPTLSNPGDRSNTEGTIVSLQLAGSDADGNSLNYSATGLPASLTVNATTGLIYGTLSDTSAGTYTVVATVSDGSLSASQTFTWTVTNAWPTSGPLVPLFWQDDSSARQVTAWYFGNSIFQGFNWISMNGVAGWRIVATSDFNRDGQVDVLFQNDTTRQLTVWYLGPALLGTPFLGWNWVSSDGAPGWTVVAAADLNGDGTPDVVWQNDTTRQVVVWYMGGAQGNTRLSWNWLSSDAVPGWRIVAAGDMNHDTKPDLIWQNDTTRQVTVWYMGGALGNVFLSWNWLSESGIPGWRIVGTSDFNADGNRDVIWQSDTTHAVTVWYMGGATGNVLLGWNWLSEAGVPGWRAVAR